jgi:hypothetical protein
MDEKAKPSLNVSGCSRRRSYLLRLWHSGEPGDNRWKASLEIPETGQRIGFPGLEELFVYLMDLTTEVPL